MSLLCKMEMIIYWCNLSMVSFGSMFINWVMS